jgi:hypothetical protein
VGAVGGLASRDFDEIPKKHRIFFLVLDAEPIVQNIEKSRPRRSRQSLYKSCRSISAAFELTRGVEKTPRTLCFVGKTTWFAFESKVGDCGS